MKIYVASSWRNEFQPLVCAELREDGHDVYDFRHPELGNDGFSWRLIGDGWQQWTVQQLKIKSFSRAGVRWAIRGAGDYRGRLTADS